jgi:hypothetical protein
MWSVKTVPNFGCASAARRSASGSGLSVRRTVNASSATATDAGSVEVSVAVTPAGTPAVAVPGRVVPGCCGSERSVPGVLMVRGLSPGGRC